jgi:hypothetical protein
MRKWASIIMLLVILAGFALGCAGISKDKISKDAKIKCPKCGAVFTVDEGIHEFETKGY